MTIGERIKALRVINGLTLEELSKHVGVTRQTLSRYETGRIAFIPYSNIELIAKTLGTAPASLMGWDELNNAH